MTNQVTQFGFDPKGLPGATRIGATWLMVPPINVHFNSPKMEDVMMTLRSQSPNHIKSGRALWIFDMDLVFSGVAQINNKLAPILATLRRTPFTMLYNETVRKIMTYGEVSNSSIGANNEVAIAVTGYTIHTEMDLPDTLIMRLSFMVFNYAPLTRSMQFLKQTIVNSSVSVTTPAQSIEDSNLFTQYVNSLLIEHDKMSDFLFSGEVETQGKIPLSTWNNLAGSAKTQYNNEFISRIDALNGQIIRNGTKVRQVSNVRYVNSPETFTIGYHVHNVQDVLDLRIGAYKSRRIVANGGWITDSSDMRKDILLTLGIPDPGPGTTTAQLINTNIDGLIDIAWTNSAGKYLKRFTILSDTRKNIEGIAVRRMIPISIIPIISSSMPTCQYMGGAETQIDLTIQTDDETFIETITGIDKAIETSQRNVLRHSGSELTYIDNDIVNLNGTFVVTVGNMDIQNIPDNPGSYILTWSFTEQGEVLRALVNPATEVKKFKKAFARAIVDTYSGWSYNNSFTTDGQYNFTPPPGKGPSYIYTVCIPSMIKAARNGFIRYLKEYATNLSSSIPPADINAQLYAANLTPGVGMPSLASLTNGPALQTSNGSYPGIPTSSSGPISNPGSAPQLAATNAQVYLDAFMGGQATVLTNLWSLSTGGAGNGGILDPIYRSWLQSKSSGSGGDGSVQDGFAQIMVDGFVARLDQVLNSPNLLQWEIQQMGGSSSGIDGTDVNLNTFMAALDQMNCYSDLGLPFTYIITDNKGNPVIGSNGKPETHTFYDPDFYVQSGPAAPPGVQSIHGNVSKSVQKIASENRSAEVQSSNKITGNLGTVVPAVQITTSTAVNSITNRSAVQKLTDNDPTTNSYQSISDTAVQSAVKQGQANLNASGQNDLADFTKTRSFKTNDELYFSDQIVSAMGQYGSETSNAAIAECQLEHKVIKSTFVDFNPHPDSSINYIIYEARKNMLEDNKYYTLNKAFPTFRFFFKIENSPQWLLFDEFFDYRAVESIRYYKDKISPCATLDIVLNNYNNILNDLKALMAKKNFKLSNANTTDSITNQYTNQPLHSLFVQPGTQIQLKLGYAGQDTNLTTVFNGFVSEVSPGERFQITCQSYGMGLLTDSSIGSILGWICSAKHLIWWMLFDPTNAQHLGGIFQPSLIPNSITDFIGGLNPPDQNIFLGEEEEPGKLRFLQLYNADNMTKWDVLQDLAAANPGYICQVVPFDNRETVFFGHPDHLYTYTNDWGVAKPYRTFDPQTIKNLAVHMPTQSAINTAESILQQDISASGTPTLNYMQWMTTSNAIKEAQNSWIASWSDGGSNAIDPRLQDILLYCKYVDLLTSLAASPESGNIQYNLFNNSAPNQIQSATVAAITGQASTVTGGINFTGYPSLQKLYNANGTTTQGPNTIQQALYSNQAIPTANPNSSTTPSITINAKVPEARLDPTLIKNTPSYIPQEIWGALKPDLQLKLGKYVIGTPISLNEFTRSVNPSIGLLFDSISMLNSLNPDDPQTIVAANELDTALTNYIQTHDESTLNSIVNTVEQTTSSGTNGATVQTPAAITAINHIYQTYGIGSMLAIVAWSKIAQLLVRIYNEFGASNSTLSNIAGNLQGSSNATTNPNTTSNNIIDRPSQMLRVVSLTQFGIALQAQNLAGQGNGVASPNGMINFTGPINTTDLKTHISLRNLILSRFVNINPIWQAMLAEMSASPVQQRFRNYHIKSSYQHIVSNNIWTSIDNMWNRVKVKYKRHDLMDIYVPMPAMIFGDKPNDDFVIQAGQTLDERMTREITVPVENARTVWQARNYATSILAEGIRHMYTGTLVITGDATIKPYDIVYIYDDYNKMYGPIEVASIEHTLSAESGFISTIVPHCYVDMLGVSVSLAAKIAKIFEYGLLATIALPVILEAGAAIGITSALGIGAEEVATEGAATTAGRSFLKDALGSAASKGKNISDAVTGFVKQTAGVTQEAYQTVVTQATENTVSQTLTNAGLNAAELTASDGQMLAGINAARAASGTPAISSIGEASTSEISSALQQLGINNSTIGSAVTKIQMAAIKAGATSGISAVFGLVPSSVSFFSGALGLTTLSVVKFLAVAAPIAYYQMFAGIDDSNYACPLNITPLSYQGEPYYAGIDSITHQSGIWNYVKGQWMKFHGSINTIHDALGEYVSALSQVVQ